MTPFFMVELTPLVTLAKVRVTGFVAAPPGPDVLLAQPATIAVAKMAVA